MKKLTLSVGLLAAILSVKAQDTTCTYFKDKRVLEFNYKTSEKLYEVKTPAKVCNGTTKSGRNCKNKTKNTSGFCHLHGTKE